MVFSGTWLRDTGGVEAVEIDAPRVRELVMALEARFPALAERLSQCAVAIDGDVHAKAAYRRLTADTEVEFIPRVAGGALWSRTDEGR